MLVMLVSSIMIGVKIVQESFLYDRAGRIVALFKYLAFYVFVCLLSDKFSE